MGIRHHEKAPFGEKVWDLFPTTPQDPQANLRPKIYMGPVAVVFGGCVVSMFFFPDG